MPRKKYMNVAAFLLLKTLLLLFVVALNGVVVAEGSLTPLARREMFTQAMERGLQISQAECDEVDLDAKCTCEETGPSITTIVCESYDAECNAAEALCSCRTMKQTIDTNPGTASVAVNICFTFQGYQGRKIITKDGMCSGAGPGTCSVTVGGTACTTCEACRLSEEQFGLILDCDNVLAAKSTGGQCQSDNGQHFALMVPKTDIVTETNACVAGRPTNAPTYPPFTLTTRPPPPSPVSAPSTGPVDTSDAAAVALGHPSSWSMSAAVAGSLWCLGAMMM